MTDTEAVNQACADVLLRLGAETRACWAEGWTKGTLSIQCDGQRLEYSLKNDAEPGRASISEKLRDLIDELYVTTARTQPRPWTGAVLTTRLEGSATKVNFSFTYPAQQAATASTSSEDLDPLRKLARGLGRYFGRGREEQ